MTLTPLATEALAVLRRIAAQHAHPGLASGFSAEDMVLIDLIGRHGLPVRVFAPNIEPVEETHALIERVREYYGLPIAIYRSDATGSGISAWITGRRAQSTMDHGVALEQFDPLHSLPTFSPLIDWSDEDVLTYLRGHGVPYNPLHDLVFSRRGVHANNRTGQDTRTAGMIR
jgi:phosphoadenosine phosphosulfate reductase